MHNLFRKFTAAAALTLVLALDAAPAKAEPVEIAQARAPRLDMILDARCEGGVAAFRMKNRGREWPGTASIQVITHDGETLLTERTMRFLRGQTATIRFLKAADFPNGVSLYFKPSWEDRGYTTGLRLRCA